MNNEEQITEKGGQSPAGEGSKRRVGFSPPEGWGLTVG